MLRVDENDERRERGAEREEIKKVDGRQSLREYSTGSKHRRGIFGVDVWMHHQQHMYIMASHLLPFSVLSTVISIDVGVVNLSFLKSTSMYELICNLSSKKMCNGKTQAG
ncbi:hypothetical protein PDE_01210 [Penicillium oxalicum 114-2]|uniref:Uncharacterized protein n=1 Tax=Penicillium oxalicum (strain 114-2 / CGMCC 5302) TaxID=933388 RepID=S7Z7X4_PENO1|nr:hypothetical protein PDE_01210 [Penicillium oxalicum 114-2]